MTNLFWRTVFTLAAWLVMIPTLANAQAMQQQRRAVDTEKKFVIFIHAGPFSPSHDVVRGVAIELAKAGYLVRAPDGDIDAVGGPGVDYFDPVAKDKAEEIAKTVNIALEKSGVTKSRPLAARRQTVNNPAEYFGVWLFDKDAEISRRPPAPGSGALPGPGAGGTAAGSAPSR